ncbi:MAG: response regulator transcription factor [Dictyoglomus sp.]|nr:response regulator transcription factor [Dictyoglomus sp.]MDW8189195.1 response regulator transcription factor [Dictyoglomus sp.]
MKIKVLIADDHTLVREGIKALLREIPDVLVVGEVGDGKELIDKLKTLDPDIVLLDISMPNVNNLSFCERIKEISENTKVIILSMHYSEEYVRSALKYGVKGYILKDSSLSELEFAIRSVFKGEIYLSPKISNILVKDYLEKVKDPLDVLTERQKEILKLLAEGYSAKEISHKLGISIKTVETHKSQIMEKLNIYDLAGLVKFAIKYGLIKLE